MKIKSFDCPKSIRNYKKLTLGNQMLGRRVICPSKSAYILDCQILGLTDLSKFGRGADAPVPTAL